jgi:hypothetical protein
MDYFYTLRENVSRKGRSPHFWRIRMKNTVFPLKEVADVFCDALLRDPAGSLLFASVYGRDGAVMQLFASLDLKTSEGGLDGFTVADPAGPTYYAAIADARNLDKSTGRFPKENLFGNLVHAFIFDKRLTRRDYANRSAWIVERIDDPARVDEQLRNCAWEVIKDLSPIPLLDAWKPHVLNLADDGTVERLSDSKFPPFGSVTGLRVVVSDAFLEAICDAVRTGVLTVDSAQANNLAVATVTERRPLFPLGRVLCTPGVQALMEERPNLANELLRRHHTGDWGCVCADDAKSNDQSLKDGSRLLSAYIIDSPLSGSGSEGVKVWIITEWDRSATTLLLPSEY